MPRPAPQGLPRITRTAAARLDLRLVAVLAALDAPLREVQVVHALLFRRELAVGLAEGAADRRVRPDPLQDGRVDTLGLGKMACLLYTSRRG